MEKGALAIIEQLYQMIAEAWGVPLGNEKCIIEREKVLSLLDELKSCLPVEIAEARRLVSSRNEFINSAKKEAESMRHQAEEQARRMVDEQEIVRIARQRAEDMTTTAESRSKELKRMVNTYLEDSLRQTEEAMSSALDDVRRTRAQVRSLMGSTEAAAAAAQEAEEPAAPEAAELPAEEIVPDLDSEL